MNQRVLSIFLAGLLPLLACGKAIGDENARRRSQSHVQIPSSVGDPDQAQQFFAQRLREAQQHGGLQKMLDDRDLRRLVGDIQRNPEKYGLQGELDKLLENGGKLDLNDPQLRQLINRVLQQQRGDVDVPGATIPHAKLEEWKDWLDRFGGNHRAAPDGGDDADPSSHKGLPGQSRSDPPHAPPKPDPLSPSSREPKEGPGPTQPKSPSPTPPVQEVPKGVNERLMQFAERLRNLDTPLQQSPAWQHFIHDLEHSIANPAAGKSALADKASGLTEHLPPLSQYLPLDRLKGDNGLSQWGKSLLPKAPVVNWGNAPKVPSAAGWHAPQLSRAGLGDPDNWTDTLWLVMLLALLVFVLLTLVWKRRLQARRAAAPWKLGPWPVDPGAVKTRDQLVRAFEYLSLLRLGPSARSRNHLEIADRLGHSAAWELAQVYEQARYAPPTDPLPDADLVTARRHLSFLAGASSA